MTDTNRKTFYILDGNSLFYRSFYAIRDLRNSKGFPTNAVYGFIKTLQKLIRERKPDYLTLTFDSKGPTFRHLQFKAYKALRKPMPEELIVQIPWIKDVVKAYRIPSIEMPGLEADDLIASLADMTKKEFEVFIVSPDKDILQLVEPHVSVIPDPTEELILDEKGVEEYFGVCPSKITDFLALAGDASDNIPGVEGIGTKSALLLLKEFSSLEQILETPWTQIGRVKKDLISTQEETARMSKQLATLVKNAPLDFSQFNFAIQEPDTKELFRIFNELEFRELLKEVLPAQAAPLFIHKIADLKEAQEMEQKVRTFKKIGIAINASGESPLTSSLDGIVIATPDQNVYVIPHWHHQEILSILQGLLNDPHILKTGYDLKKIYLVLSAYKITLQGIFFDPMIASFVVNPGIHHKSLGETVAHTLKKIIPEPQALDLSTFAPDALASLELEEALTPLLIDSNQKELFEKIEMPLVEVLAKMEGTGIPVDKEVLHRMSKELQELLKTAESRIHEFSDESFNINSPKELSRILFEKLKLPVIKKTKTGYSTNAEVLTELKDKHEIIPWLLEYRQVSKLKSTYVDALPQLILPTTGRLHTTFSQTIAETGRLSSANPNLQNIPIKTSLGKKIRSAFVAPDEHQVLVSADYSQIELRVLAHLSKDPGLVQAFQKDEDIHRWTAQAMFNVAAQDVTDAMRSRAKVINFGIIYGMGSYGLSKELGTSVDEAKKFMDHYFERFPSVQRFLNEGLEKAKTHGYVTTLFKRRRYLPDLKSPQPQIRQLAERMAINTPIQGTAADLIKLAMIRLDESLGLSHLHAKLSLQIHDELILIVPKDELEIVQSLMKDCMENVVSLDVKLKVDIHTGKNWMEL